MKLAGRHAIVTGAGRGIGAAIATLFAREGAVVVLAARSEAEITAVAEQIRSTGGQAVTAVADVSNPEDASRLAERAVSELGSVDVLVNCAGIYGPIGPTHEVDAGAWMRAVEVNLFGTFHCCRAVLPSMIARRHGKIVNMSGGGATAPLPRFSAYAVSKAAVVRLTETLAAEVAEYGIDVNAIAPGAVDTRLQDDVLAAGDRAGDLYGRIRAMRESGAGGTPVGVPAELALFLASDDSNHLTGRLIAAPHDPWREWDSAAIETLDGTPWYTLRRVDPHTIRPLLDKL